MQNLSHFLHLWPYSDTSGLTDRPLMLTEYLALADTRHLLSWETVAPIVDLLNNNTYIVQTFFLLDG